MTDTSAQRHIAAAELHRLTLDCLQDLRRRAAAADGEAAHEEHQEPSEEWALGIEMRQAAPSLLLLAKQPGDLLSREALRVEFAQFDARQTELARVAAAIVNMLLQDAAPQTRSEVVKLVKGSDAFLSLYVRPSPFEASLELHAGSDLMELGRIADRPEHSTLQ